MNETIKLIIEKLEGLAIALQINVIEIFPYFVMQVKIQAITFISLSLLSTIALISLTRYSYKHDWDTDEQGILMAFTIIVGIVGILIIGSHMSDVFIPEPTAIKQIINLLKGD